MIRLFSLVFCSCVTLPVLAAPGSFLRLADGVSRYVEVKPATAGRPTVVMVNGLVYGTERWNPFRSELARRGYGFVNYDFRGQRFTLRRELDEKRRPEFFLTGLDPVKMAMELEGVLDGLGLRQPVVVVGLSYGAPIAAEFARRRPERVASLVFMAPLVVPLDRYNPTGRWVMLNLDVLRLSWGPVFGPLFYEAAYAQIYRSYYRQRIVPENTPAELAGHSAAFRESVFHLTRAVRDFDLRRYDFAGFPRPTVHFLTAGDEDPNALRDQLQAFDAVRSPGRGVLVHLPQSSHAIPDSAGALAADLVERLLTRDARLVPGRKYRMTSQGPVLWNGSHAHQDSAR